MAVGQGEGVAVAETIFERYGGFAKVSRVVSSFYDRVLDSDRLAPYFAHVDMRRLIDHQTKFVASLMGGPVSYTNEHLARVHARLAIDDVAFDELAALLRETLEDFDYDETDIAAVYGRIVASRPFIVTKPAAVGAADGA
jgi:hemoglobin